MKVFIHFAVLVFLLAIQSLILLPDYLIINFTLIYFILLVSLVEDWEAIVLGLALGIMVDVISVSIIGLHTIVYSVVAYIVTSLRYRKLLTQKFEFAIVLVVVTLILSFIQILSIANGAFGYTIEWHNAFKQSVVLFMLLQSIVNAVIFLMFCNLVIRFNNFLETLLGSTDGKRSLKGRS